MSVSRMAYAGPRVSIARLADTARVDQVASGEQIELLPILEWRDLRDLVAILQQCVHRDVRVADGAGVGVKELVVLGGRLR